MEPKNIGKLKVISRSELVGSLTRKLTSNKKLRTDFSDLFNKVKDFLEKKPKEGYNEMAHHDFPRRPKFIDPRKNFRSLQNSRDSNSNYFDNSGFGSPMHIS